MTRNIELVSKIFKEIIGNDFSEETILSIFYILYNYEIYFSSSIQQEDYIDVDYPLDLTLRACAATTAYIESGIYDEENYMLWLNKYRNEFPNPNKLPIKYTKLVDELLDAMKSHDSINRVVENL